MTQENVAQPGMQETADGIRAFIVAQVAMSLHNPHLQVIGVRPAHEHVHIVVGFYHDRIRLAGERYRLIGHPAYVCHDYEPAVIHADGIADSLGGIMRDFEIPYPDSINVIPSAPPEHLSVTRNRILRGTAECKRPVQFVRGIHGFVKILAELVLMADMVLMIVGHQHGSERIFRQSGGIERLAQSADTHSGIYKYPPVLCPEIVAVAAAAARKAHEPDHYKSPSCSQYLFMTLYASPTPSSPARDRSMHPFSLSLR